MRLRRIAALLAPALALTLLLGVAGPAQAGHDTMIKIHRLSFFPNTMTVAPGARVLVKNLDSKQGVPHSVTADAGEDVFDTEPFLGQASFVAPSTPGVYWYHCEVHEFMHGFLDVTG
jgi:plastocyanin